MNPQDTREFFQLFFANGFTHPEIAAKLALTNPQAFVITLEQPGGVVKSKQEKVVALAKL